VPELRPKLRLAIAAKEPIVMPLGKFDVAMDATRRIEQIATRAGQLGNGISDAANPFDHADIIATMGDASQPVP
jgi:hypothetical protein